MIDKRYDSGKRFLKYSESELDNARHTDMVEFLERHEGFSFKHSGSYSVGREHDSLVIDPDHYTWHWYSQDLFGKGAIDWLIKVNGYRFAEAAEILIGTKPVTNGARDSPRFNTKAPQARPDDAPVPFSPPKRFEGKCRELFAYLGVTRKLPEDIIKYCVSNKMIYQDEKKRAVFCGYDKNGEMKFAEAKITNTYKKYYPQNIAGSNKAFSFFIPASPSAMHYDPTQLYVFEAPIDLLSHGALMQMALKKQCAVAGDMSLYRADCWLGFNRLSLSGVSDKALEQRLKDNPHISKIALCLDNDEKGQAAAQRIKQKFGDRCKVKIVKPPYGKDWNDTLKAAVSSNLNPAVKKNNIVKPLKP